MDAGFINIGLAFLEGLGLIVSPCILPILPIILSGSLTGSKARPLGIITGFVITFTLVTLFSRALVQFAHISPDTLRNISYVILILLGVMMLSTYLTEKFNILTQRLTNVGGRLQSANNPQSGFAGGLAFGGLIGIIWTPCAGPILAAVIVQSIIQSTTLSSLLIVIAFAIGASVPMLFIALMGRKIMERFSFFRDKSAILRKVLGIIIIASVFFLIFYTSLTLSLAQSGASTSPATALMNGIEKPYPAPELATDSVWINSPPLQLNQLKGKVVLIDFWTYSCINCIRTLPYLKDWYAKYHDNGFVIIGVHSPEFEFEKNVDNVKNAVKADGILYPVTLDNQYITWKNFNNQYWPAHYLINKNGDVVYEHFGEGDYDVTENNIRYLLGIPGPVTIKPVNENYSALETPETYLGYARAAAYSSPESVTKNKSATYSYPVTLSINTWALRGDWIIYNDKIVSAKAGASIKLRFHAGNVYTVMGTTGKPVTVKLLLNGEKNLDESGKDVTNGLMTVSGHRLYTIATLKREGEGIVELTAANPGLEIFTFTFGS